MPAPPEVYCLAILNSLDVGIGSLVVTIHRDSKGPPPLFMCSVLLALLRMTFKMDNLEVRAIQCEQCSAKTLMTSDPIHCQAADGSMFIRGDQPATPERTDP